MKHDHTHIMKAIWGIVLMLNLALVPFYDAAIAAGNNAPAPHTPEATPKTTPERGFETNEETAAVLGITGAVAEVSLQPEFEDPTLQDLFDFHVLAFETVFDRDYDGTESAYFFEQPLDESTYATVVPGWNTVGEPVDALVLLARPIDVSDIEPNEGITIISAAHIAGTLHGVADQGFWGISVVYDFIDGVRYNDLFLLQDLDETTEQALLVNAGLMDYGRGEPEKMQACIAACESAMAACMNAAYVGLGTCQSNAATDMTVCILACAGLGVGIGAIPATPGIGLLVGIGVGLGCAGMCMVLNSKALTACVAAYNAAAAVCLATFNTCLTGCGITIAYSNIATDVASASQITTISHMGFWSPSGIRFAPRGMA